ncbi:MAG TPA: glycosyltransferase family 4 protein, partial [Acidimicrobiia bacterium]|nr:glycosyltransferase family 4 protein [Acidimicrobiia bacterium]
MTKVAVVHDDLTQRGGAERVVLSLTRLFPDAPVFTTIYDSEATYPEFRDVDVRTTFLQHGPTGNPRALLPFYPAAIRSIDLSGYDLVVSSSSRFAHGVRVPDGYHLTYCYSPPRYLYQADGYFGPGGPVGHRTGKMLKPVLGM